MYWPLKEIRQEEFSAGTHKVHVGYLCFLFHVASLIQQGVGSRLVNHQPLFRAQKPHQRNQLGDILSQADSSQSSLSFLLKGGVENEQQRSES